MNTKALERFAQAARRQLLDEVGAKVEQVLATDSAELREKADAIQQLRVQIKASSKQAVIDRVAYTWFNRFCGLRFMDAHHYTHAGVVSPLPGNTQPEILQDAKQGHIADDLKATVDSERVLALLSGELPSADPQQEAYRLLLVGVCNQYHRMMPFLFEKIADYTELLMPDDLLSEASLLHAMREAMTGEVCEDIEVIGWLYQFYISEKKDQVIGKVVASEDIPAATQLFTPNWIVKYMVENSLGAQWLATYPQSPLKGQMAYYIEPAKQTDEVNAQLAAITPSTLDPETMTLIDPASGSGHILVEAYELFKAIYLEKGYNQQNLPKLILEKNLFGLEICPRAAQLTGFALMMQGRADDRRLFERGVKLNVMALVDSGGREQWQGIGEQLEKLPTTHSSLATEINELVDLFEHATTFGSLIQVPEELAEKLPALKQLSEATSQDLFVSEALKRLGPLVQQAKMLAAQYDAVVANPPYMSRKFCIPLVKQFLAHHFEAGKADLYAAFVIRNIQLSVTNGRIGMITIPNWMFLSSYEGLRETILRHAPISSLAHNGRGVWGSDFGSCSFILNRSHPEGLAGLFLRLFNKQGSVANNEELAQRFKDNSRYTCINTEFRRLPSSPIAYWASDAVRNSFGAPSIREFAISVGQQKTGDNEKYVRAWWELQLSTIGKERKWLTYVKGGPFQKWFGNLEHVIDWSEEARKYYREDNRGRIIQEEYWYKPGISWTFLTASYQSYRFLPIDAVSDITGSSIYFKSESQLVPILGFLNSAVCRFLTSLTNPSLALQVRNVMDLPMVFPPGDRIENIAKKCLKSTQDDYRLAEISAEFCALPLLAASADPTPTLESSYTAWITQNQATVAEMKRLEEENNRLFINAYGLQDDLTPDVPWKEITLTCNPYYRYKKQAVISSVDSGECAVGSNESYPLSTNHFPLDEELETRFRQDTMDEFISYAVGCMLGRYSLDKPGLILANQGETLADYIRKVCSGECIVDRLPTSHSPLPTASLSTVSFLPDADNVIPILDGDWFTDDIVDRFCLFLRVTFGEEHYQENLTFLEDALGKPLRRYFLKDFYKSHVKRYKKRPIYWLFSSPKGSFNALIYMHRYTPDTASIILNDYLREFRAKLASHREHLEHISISSSASSQEKTAALKEIEKLKAMIEELDAYESDTLYPLATQRIEIDLDDGVKVNYNKFGKALQGIPGLTQ